MNNRQLRRRLRRLETNTRKIVMLLDSLHDRLDGEAHVFVGTADQFEEWDGIDGCDCETCQRARNMGIAPIH